MKGFVVFVVVVSAFLAVSTMDYNEANYKQERKLFSVDSIWPNLVLRRISNDER